MNFLGMGIIKLVSLWKFLSSFPFVWKLIKNYADIKLIFEELRDVFESAKESGGLPSCEKTKVLLNCIETIFRKELIDFPNVDEVEIADLVREVKFNLVCAVDSERKKRGLN